MVRGKELELVSFDGTTEIAAELVLFEFRARGSDGVEEKRVGVQGVVAEVLPGRAVILVGAALGDDVDVSAGVPAIRCIVLAGLHFKFLNGVRIGNGDAVPPSSGWMKPKPFCSL